MYRREILSLFKAGNMRTCPSDLYGEAIQSPGRTLPVGTGDSDDSKRAGAMNDVAGRTTKGANRRYGSPAASTADGTVLRGQPKVPAGARILIVEDDVSLGKFLSRALKLKLFSVEVCARWRGRLGSPAERPSTTW